jgi:thiol-disulfide isomerase/thioredoxin
MCLRLAILAALCGLLVTTTVRANAEDSQEKDLTVDQIIDGITRSEALINDLDVMIVASQISEDSPMEKGPNGEDQPIPQHYLCHTVVNSQGRCRDEGFCQQLRVGPEPGKSSLLTRHWLVVFDGTEAREFTFHGIARSPRVGLQSYATWYTPSPLEFTTHYFQSRVSHQLRERGAKLVGWEDLDGQRIAVIEQEPFKNNGLWKLRFWVNPRQNFTIVRRAGLVQQTEDTDWVVYTHIDGKAHTKMAESIWLPKDVVYESFKVEQGKATGVSWRFVLALSQWKVNQHPPIKNFREPIPNGAWVTDHRSAEPRSFRYLEQDGNPSATKDNQSSAEKPAQPDIYDTKADGAAKIAEALAKAKTTGKQVLLMYGANWCGPCHKLHDLFESDAKVHDYLTKNYVLVMLDIDNELNQALAQKYKADWETTGVPYLTVLDADGAVVVNDDTIGLSDGPKFRPDWVLEFLNKHIARGEETANP